MATFEREQRGDDKVDRKQKKDKYGKKSGTSKIGEQQKTASAAFSLLANEDAVNPVLSSLFAAKPTLTTAIAPPRATAIRTGDVYGERDADIVAKPVERVNGSDREIAYLDGGEEAAIDARNQAGSQHEGKRKRKRKHDEEEIEDVYMRRLEREETKEADLAAAAERATKRQKASSREGSVSEAEEGDVDGDDGLDNGGASGEVEQDEGEGVDTGSSPPPLHETQQSPDIELSKANRTVFLGNVSTAAITSKSAHKTLLDHLRFFFPSLAQPKDGDEPGKHTIESLRFRSTPYATAIPKKASFARKEVMDATTKSTNAYAVYSSPILAREAARRLNGTVVLDRHLRVDEVAHPAKVDHHRCVFVGNLGFVDDESNIQAANKEAGYENRRPASKQAADQEEGLWRTFGTCGTVESVRVIRDSTTRVGKGIAYVQFEDENAVEAALLYEGKKFPPMLPRKLRVSRAKAQKRNAKPGSDRPSSGRRPSTNGYQRKISVEERSRMGRAGRLFGRAGAAQMRKSDGETIHTNNSAFKRPEAFVFEGYRASSGKGGGGKSGLKLGKRKGGKPMGRSAKRGAAFKAGKKRD